MLGLEVQPEIFWGLVAELAESAPNLRREGPKLDLQLQHDPVCRGCCSDGIAEDVLKEKLQRFSRAAARPWDEVAQEALCCCHRFVELLLCRQAGDPSHGPCAVRHSAPGCTERPLGWCRNAVLALIPKCRSRFSPIHIDSIRIHSMSLFNE